MSKIVKIAVSLPEDLLEKAEQERKASGESRSAFIRRAIRTTLKQKEKEETISNYIKGYNRLPETAVEIELAQKSADIVFAEDPWE